MSAERLNCVRRFIRVQGRGVHYLRAGAGPPVVLLHAAMASAHSLLPLMQRLACDHTVFAFDHPGYGDSDPLEKREVTLAEAADALADTLATVQMPRCPVFGSHTGGAMALELAHRHPERVSALVIEGPCMFSAEEARGYRNDDYMPPFEVKDDGTHLLSIWVATRDLMTWFPWNTRTASHRRRQPFPSADHIHTAFLERMRAGEGYRSVYRAAFIDGKEAVEELRIPATFMATADDPLFAHLDRLPSLKTDQHIRRYPAEGVDYRDETVSVLRSYRVDADAPVDPPFEPTTGKINRRYVDTSKGQVLVRSAGESRDGRPLVLLHEGRAASSTLEPLMRELSGYRPVYAPDLPDNGASDPLPTAQPQIDDYAASVSEMVAELRLGPCDLYAVGAGAAVALQLRSRPPFKDARIVLDTPDFYSSDVSQRLSHDWAPVLQPQWDGAHLNRIWLMLRDEYSFWPWFDRSPAAACARDVPSDAQPMHLRAVDILRSLPTYHRLTEAALRYEWEAPLSDANHERTVVAVTVDDPRRVHIEAATRRAHWAGPVLFEEEPGEKARSILRLLDEGARLS